MDRLFSNMTRLLSFLIFVLGVCPFATAAADSSPKAEHVFIVSIDGGKPAVIEQCHLPVLEHLVANGAHTWSATTIFPSITLPSHTSMLTGVGPARHKILWNDWRPSAGTVCVPTVFSEAKDAGFSTAMFVGKEKFRHLVRPGSVDFFDFDRDHSGEVLKPVLGTNRLEKTSTVLAHTVAEDAARYICKEKPALCFIHLTDPDDAGHRYGWGSPQQVTALQNVDAALGIVLKALDDAAIAEKSVVIVTADHGGHGRIHGLNVPDDLNIPWIIWGEHVKHGFTITEPVKTYDTAVTALWLLGVASHDTFDGHVISSFLTTGQTAKSGG